jgi:hypothetical protein
VEEPSLTPWKVEALATAGLALTVCDVFLEVVVARDTTEEALLDTANCMVGIFVLR